MPALHIDQTAIMPPPVLTAAMRDNLIRGHRATLRRYFYLRDCARKASRARDDQPANEAARLTVEIARLTTDIAELETL